MLRVRSMFELAMRLLPQTRSHSPVRCRSAMVMLTAVLVAALATDPRPAVAQEPEAVLVGVEKTRIEPLSQTVPIAGRLVSLRVGDVAARIAGPVEGIRVEVGDPVSEGQVLAVLDNETLQAEVNMSNSELAEAQAELETWVAEKDVALTELRRQEGLRKSAAFSQARFEDAQKKAAVADARVGRARANVAIKRTNLQRRQIDFEYATIRAPYAGVVVRRYTEVGAYVSKGDRIVRVIADRALEVEADVPFRRLAGLPIGRQVDFTLDDGTKHVATVRAILPSENPLTRTRVVRLVPDFSETKRPLAESQAVIVAVPISDDREVVTVHKDAILKRPTGDMVFVIQDDKATPRPVTVGEAIGGRLEVVSGLKNGEMVVIRGNERIQPGAKVRVEKGSS